MDASTSLDKAIDLLQRLHEEGRPRRVTDLASSLGVPKSSAHRLLKTLVRRGFAEQDGTGRYQIGPALIGLGLGALEREPVVALARPVLEAEAAALGETVFLTAPRGGQIVVLDKAEGTGFLRAAPRVGQTVPLLATAVGRLALAFAPDRFSLGALPPTRFTAETEVELAALRELVARARADGFAINRGEWIEGLSVAAAPVLGAGVLVAALAAAAPSARLAALGEETVARRLVAAAKTLSAQLAGRDPAFARMA